jgi:hypothetical protein
MEPSVALAHWFWRVVSMPGSAGRHHCSLLSGDGGANVSAKVSAFALEETQTNSKAEIKISLFILALRISQGIATAIGGKANPAGNQNPVAATPNPHL